MVEARHKMQAQDRKSAILRYLHEGGTVAVADLAQRFEISDMTVRRDLAELERDGLLERVHGGARRPPAGPLSLIDDVEPEFEARAALNRAAKRAIAHEAALALSGLRTIAMDVGTTILTAAEALAENPGSDRQHVFTNSLRIASALSGRVGKVYMSGGRVRDGELSLLGPGAMDSFCHLNFEIAVLCASGVTADGFFDYSIEETEMKRLYLERAQRRIVLCDSSKFCRLSTTRICPLGAVDTLITDAAPPADLVSALKGAGVDLRVAKPI